MTTQAFERSAREERAACAKLVDDEIERVTAPARINCSPLSWRERCTVEALGRVKVAILARSTEACPGYTEGPEGACGSCGRSATDPAHLLERTDEHEEIKQGGKDGDAR